jgi:hypothetical protein
MSSKKLEKIVQANKLVEARYCLSLQEKRFVLWLLSKIKREDVNFKKYEIKVTDFASMMGLNVDTQYKEMKSITANLVTRLIKIEDKKTRKEKQLA